MHVYRTQAPSLQELRPAHDRLTTPGFPVYDDLLGVLDEPDPVPGATLSSFRTAHVLATLAGYAYGDADAIATVAARLGLTGNRCVRVAEEVDALLITSTAFVLQSEDGSTVIVAYCGTQPTDLVTLAADLDTYPEKIRVPSGPLAGTDVHSGFYRNMRATATDIVATLERALHGHPISDEPDPEAPERGPLAPMTSLHITGHSLGGAMAAFLALLLADQATSDGKRAEIARTLRTVHTFGQPMLGSPAFARAAGELPWPGHGGGRFDEHLLRWIHRDDIVATFPSTSSGPYAHVGRERRFRRGAWRPEPATRQMSGVLGFALIPLSVLTRTFTLPRELWFGPSLSDHFPERYIRTLAPAGVTTEFGD